jgi:hypothetical protein
MGLTVTAEKPLAMQRIVRTWWPLAASWLLMALELPALSVVVARLPDPEIHLAAYGSVVFSIALIIEAPIIMLLSASTALSKDWDSYTRIYRFMMRTGAALTVLHLIIALTPLYDVVVRDLIGAPEEIIGPARIGLIIMTPWTWAIAYRRFQQGVLIRFGHSRTVGIGTMIRLSADIIVLVIGYLIGTLPGIVVATSAVAAGVTSEAIYAGLAVRPVLRHELKSAPPVEPPLTLHTFMGFYVPLVMTSFLTMIARPIISAGLSRMPDALASLAVWPVVSSFSFLLSSLGVAYNEVVVALLDEPCAVRSLRRFAAMLSGVLTVVIVLVAATPLSELWFGGVVGLSAELTHLASRALWLLLPMPALNVLISWFQGTILHDRRTRGITEAVAIYLAVNTGVLVGGIYLGGQPIGLYVGVASFAIATAAQMAWLWLRSRPAMQAVQVCETDALEGAEAAIR